ncbi:hypothetical protein [Tenacibaculum aquimarinum]|uniref:hypothetical protein n=1 Tax=Tenacibaculum aquimarinum TaxID=2910675 RepID=UPI001F0B3A65|nr:hypothetical protein [Tenacibaculum aquimarinum]MCH3885669.1 hypothetical protein [Tenacibaculum aquimarinum]
MKFNDLILELENLSSKGFSSRGKIAWWLIKYEKRYQGLSKIKNTLSVEFPNQNLRKQKGFIKELLFIELYEYLNKVFDNSKNIVNNHEDINLNDIINKIKTSTNGLDRKDKNFKWNSKYRE